MAPALLHYPQLHRRRITPAVIYRYAARHEIMLAATIYVDHLLRIAVEQRKPRALNLHHDAVPFEKRMGNARHRQTHLLDTAGLERLPCVKPLR